MDTVTDHHAHTDEQLDILNAAESTTDNLMISALAGCGKTSTLEAIESVLPRGPVLYLVFNRKNADEAAKRMLSTTTVRTFNSIGHRIWAQSQSKNLKVDPKKSGAILKSIIDDAPKAHRDAIWSVFSEVTSGVGLAKSLGYVPAGVYPNAKRLITQNHFYNMLDEVPDDLTADLIDTVLTRSIKAAYDGVIDYNDQVYMPALFGGIFPKYPTVLVDEYQDLSPVNHTLLERLAKGRLIGVGDPFQNIYGFRGAKAGGMKDAAAAYRCTELPLSISFRCPSEIVRNVHWRVPHFRWLTEGGSVETPQSLHPDHIPDECTVICRNNTPLFRFAMQCLAHGRSISLAGSDIGPRLVGIMRKLGDESLPKVSVLSAIEDWLEAKLEKESKTAEDTAGCMRVFAEHGATLGQAIAYAEHLFKQTGRMHLTTGHKAKGLEWSTVFFLDPWLVRKHPTEQDKNLDYVISTRSRNRLIEIDSETIEW
jgi:DNA helicase II / ATP-dependent DNA helicase PcrA